MENGVNTKKVEKYKKHHEQKLNKKIEKKDNSATREKLKLKHKKKWKQKKYGRENTKMSTEELLSKYAFKATRDAEWLKRTMTKIDETKQDLDDKFLTEESRAKKIDFIRKLKTKVKDYKDALQNNELYKSIRFYERRKLERMLTKSNKKIEEFKKVNETTKYEDSIEYKNLLKEKDEIVNNINYVKFFPPCYKYYSLFPKKDIDNEETIKKREKMKNKIVIFLNTRKNKQKRAGLVKGHGIVDYEDETGCNTIMKDDFFEVEN